MSQPKWIKKPLTGNDVAAIIQGGCASGAYMPAVTYVEATETMAEHGDDVLQYLEDIFGEIPQPPKDSGWSGIACFYLSTAVEVYALGLEEHADWENNEILEV